MLSHSNIEAILATQALVPTQIRAPMSPELIVGDRTAMLIDADQNIKGIAVPRLDVSLENFAQIARKVADVLIDDGRLTQFVSTDGFLFSGQPVSYFGGLEHHPTFRVDGMFSAVGLPFAKALESDPIEKEIESIKCLQNGWAGASSVAPIPASLEHLKSLYTLAKIDGWLPARAFAAPDGEVGLAWEAGTGYASVSFWNDKSMSYYARAADGGTEHGEEIPNFQGQIWPDELLKILSTLR